MDDKNWEQGPSTTNPVESLNRQSLQEGGVILHALMENTLWKRSLQRERDNVLQIITWQAEGQTKAYKSRQVWWRRSTG